jgi:hypothetical protein
MRGIHRWQPHEVKLVEYNLVEMVIPETPQNLAGDESCSCDCSGAARLPRFHIAREPRLWLWRIATVSLLPSTSRACLPAEFSASCTLRAQRREFLGHASAWLLAHSVTPFMRWLLSSKLTGWFSPDFTRLRPCSDSREFDDGWVSWPRRFFSCVLFCFFLSRAGYGSEARAARGAAELLAGALLAMGPKLSAAARGTHHRPPRVR